MFWTATDVMSVGFDTFHVDIELWGNNEKSTDARSVVATFDELHDQFWFWAG